MNDKLDMKAFDDGGADQFLRETMEGHLVAPRKAVWKGISRNLLWKELIHINFTNVSWKFWMAGSVGLIVVISAIYFGFPDMTPGKPASTGRETFIPGASSSGNVAARTSSGLKDGYTRKGAENSPDPNRPVQAPSVQTSTKTGIAPAHELLASGTRIRTKSGQTFLPESATVPAAPDEISWNPSPDNGLAANTGIYRVSPLTATLSYALPGTDTIITITNPMGVIKFTKTKTGTDRFFSANLGITPEIAFYSEPEVYSKTNFWLNGEVTYHISRFTIASGFGLGYVYDEGDYRVEYKSQDSIGYFTGVTSYTVGINNEIIYNTHTVNVYDSLQHLDDFRTRNRYSYLQVPLLLGYRFFETNRISLSFQTGPAISILLGSRQSDPVIEYSNATIIRVDDNTPARVKTNWQIWANLYLEMRMNKNVSLFLEPSFKYYFKPMVTQENGTGKSPWTIGLGVGIQFNFGHKKMTP
jgi:hypothetical protein